MVKLLVICYTRWLLAFITKIHGIIGVHKRPLNLGPPLVGLLAISDPQINVCAGPPNTYIASKQFNLLPPNTLF